MDVYYPNQYSIQIGLPATPEQLLGQQFSVLNVTVTDWIQMNSTKAVKKFNFLQGVVSNEPFIDYIPNSARVFSLSVLQKSPQVRDLRRLVKLQEIGFIGWPFSLIENAEEEGNRQTSIYNSFIEDDPDETFSIDGAAWNFNIIAIYGQTIYR